MERVIFRESIAGNHSLEVKEVLCIEVENSLV